MLNTDRQTDSGPVDRHRCLPTRFASYSSVYLRPSLGGQKRHVASRANRLPTLDCFSTLDLLALTDDSVKDHGAWTDSWPMVIRE